MVVLGGVAVSYKRGSPVHICADPKAHDLNPKWAGGTSEHVGVRRPELTAKLVVNLPEALTIRFTETHRRAFHFASGQNSARFNIILRGGSLS